MPKPQPTLLHYDPGTGSHFASPCSCLFLGCVMSLHLHVIQMIHCYSYLVFLFFFCKFSLFTPRFMKSWVLEKRFVISLCTESAIWCWKDNKSSSLRCKNIVWHLYGVTVCFFEGRIWMFLFLCTCFPSICGPSSSSYRCFVCFCSSAALWGSVPPLATHLPHLCAHWKLFYRYQQLITAPITAPLHIVTMTNMSSRAEVREVEQCCA